MKNLALSAAVLGLASLAGACTSNGAISASWTLQDWNDTTKTATTAQCPAGGDTAIVYTLPSGLTDPASATKDLFNCTDNVGLTAPLLADTYTTWVEITDHSGAVLYAQSNSQQIGVASGANSTAAFTFQVNRGYVTGAWSLKGQSGTPLDCTSAGAGGVEFDNMVGSNTPISDQFNCTDGMGTTYPLPIANYQFAAQAIDSSNPPLGIGPATVVGPANVQFGNQTVNKGSFVLTIDGK